MGYIRHRAVLAIVTYNHTLISKFVEEFRTKLTELHSIAECKNLIIESEGVVNGTRTYVFIPDGSKLGWDEEKTIYPHRKYFMQKMSELGADCIYLEFGGDDFGKVLIDHGHVYRSQD